jgi:hypothetical protein
MMIRLTLCDNIFQCLATEYRNHAVLICNLRNYILRDITTMSATTVSADGRKYCPRIHFARCTLVSKTR